MAAILSGKKPILHRSCKVVSRLMQQMIPVKAKNTLRLRIRAAHGYRDLVLYNSMLLREETDLCTEMPGRLSSTESSGLPSLQLISSRMRFTHRASADMSVIPLHHMSFRLRRFTQLPNAETSVTKLQRVRSSVRRFTQRRSGDISLTAPHPDILSLRRFMQHPSAEMSDKPMQFSRSRICSNGIAINADISFKEQHELKFREKMFEQPRSGDTSLM